EAVGIERLVGGIAEPAFPVDRFGVDGDVRLFDPVAVPVPGEMDLVNLAELAGLHDLVPFLNVRHRPLLHADLDDPLVVILGLDDGGSFGEVVREGLFDVDVLPCGTGGDGQRGVPVVRGADGDGVELFAGQQLLEFLGRERVGFRELFAEAQSCVRNVADGGDFHAGNRLER